MFDGSDGLNPAQGRLCRSQRSEALPEAQETLKRSVFVFVPVVSPLSVDLSDAFKMWVTSVIELTHVAPIGNLRLLHCGFCDFCIHDDVVFRRCGIRHPGLSAPRAGGQAEIWKILDGPTRAVWEEPRFSRFLLEAHE